MNLPAIAGSLPSLAAQYGAPFANHLWQSTQGGPSIFAAVQEQLGLKLLQSNEQTAPVEVLVIDHAERVTGNEQANAARLN